MSMPIESAKLLLQANGYVVIKAKSYRAAQERQRVAEALRAAAEDQVASIERWAVRSLDDERRLRDRCEFLYGAARAHGATDDELAADALTQLRELVAWTDGSAPDTELNRRVRADIISRARETLGLLT